MTVHKSKDGEQDDAGVPKAGYGMAYFETLRERLSGQGSLHGME